MIVRVLGSAAGGGLPQWNCACANCCAARRGRLAHRTQSSFALSAGGDTWWLVNVSPDIAAQIETFSPLQPRQLRGTPIAGMLVTDANIDHLGGLSVLRQGTAHGFSIFSSTTVRDVARTQPAFAPFLAAPHRWTAMTPGARIDLDEGLAAWAIAVPGQTPGYAGRRRVADAVYAFVVQDLRARHDSDMPARVLFAPVFEAATPELIEAAATADAAFLDGTFWSDDELDTVGAGKPARGLGHLPIDGPDGTLRSFAGQAKRTELFFCHVNNTNPVLDPQSPQRKTVADAGFAVAEDGMVLRSRDRSAAS